MRRNERDVNSRWPVEPASPAELALSVALVTCPSLLVPYGAAPFEPHKAAFLWAAAFVALVATLAAPGRLSSAWTASGWTRAFLIAVACSAVALAASASMAASPSLAWWGSGLRRFGGLTELALGGVLAAAVVSARDAAALDRLVTALVLGSIGPTLYGLTQWLGIDPLALQPQAWQRPGSTFGNPLFFSGYLATVLPLTVGFAATRTERPSAISAWALVALQAGALSAARATGPLLSLAAAASIAAAAALASLGWRRIAAGVALAASLAAVVAVVGTGRWMHAGTASIAALQELEDRNRATVGVRSLLWRAAGSGIPHQGLALALGSGPESSTRVLTQYSGPFLRLIEGQDVAPDRAHNDTLDRVVMLGLVGLAARLAILYTALGAAFALLGLLTPSDRFRFPLLAVGTIAAFVLSAWTLDGAWTLAISVPGAMAATGSFWIVWNAQAAPGAAGRNPELVWPVAAGLAAWLAHGFETQIGIASIGSALAGALALATTVARAARAGQPAQLVRAPWVAASRPSDDGSGLMAGWTPAVLLVGLTGAATVGGPSVWLIASITWLLANLVIGLRLPALVWSGAVWLVAAAAWAISSAGNPTLTAAGLLASRVTVFYGMAGAWVVALAWQTRRRGAGARGEVPAWMGLAVAAILSVRVSTAVSSADVRLGYGGECERQRDFECAIAEYREAGRADPSDARVPTRLARVLVARADAPDAADRRDTLFHLAGEQLSRAWALDPFDYHNARNPGALERRWARGLPDQARAAHLEAAERWYAASASLAPFSRAVWAEWANLKLERRLPDAALPMLERSVGLGTTDEARALSDALLGARGIDVQSPGGAERAAADLDALGYPRLAALYLARTPGSRSR